MLVRWPIIIPVGHLSCPFDEFSSWHADSQIHHRAYRPNGCNIYMNLYVYVRMCIIMHPRMCTCIRKCMFGYVRICTCSYAFVRVFIRMYGHTSMRACMYQCMRVCTHVYLFFDWGCACYAYQLFLLSTGQRVSGLYESFPIRCVQSHLQAAGIRMLEWCCFITYFAAVLIAVLVFQSTMCVKFCPQRYRVNRL